MEFRVGHAKRKIQVVSARTQWLAAGASGNDRVGHGVNRSRTNMVVEEFSSLTEILGPTA
jgi:hypothetical protein